MTALHYMSYSFERCQLLKLADNDHLEGITLPLSIKVSQPRAFQHEREHQPTRPENLKSGSELKESRVRWSKSSFDHVSGLYPRYVSFARRCIDAFKT